MSCIRYRCGYKYQTTADYRTQVEILPPAPIVTDWISIDEAGWLTIRRGYAWDGPSGPTVDTPDAMRGSLVHDALYQLLRERLLPQSARKYADAAFRRILREDGMWAWRIWYWNLAVRLGAAPAANPTNRPADLTAGCGCSP